MVNLVVPKIALFPVLNQCIERILFSVLAFDNEPFVETAFFQVAHSVLPVNTGRSCWVIGSRDVANFQPNSYYNNAL